MTTRELIGRVEALERELAALREQLARVAAWRHAPYLAPPQTSILPYIPWVGNLGCPMCGTYGPHTCVIC